MTARPVTPRDAERERQRRWRERKRAQGLKRITLWVRPEDERDVRAAAGGRAPPEGEGAGARRRLPPRRLSETRRLAWAGRTVHVTIGYGSDGLQPREIFYSDGYRCGSDMAALVADLCIALSVILQHRGVTAAALCRSMGETFELRTGRPEPASILGLLLGELSRPPDWAGRLPEPAPGDAAGGDVTAWDP